MKTMDKRVLSILSVFDTIQKSQEYDDLEIEEFTKLRNEIQEICNLLVVKEKDIQLSDTSFHVKTTWGIRTYTYTFKVAKDAPTWTVSHSNFSNLLLSIYLHKIA